MLILTFILYAKFVASDCEADKVGLLYELRNCLNDRHILKNDVSLCRPARDKHYNELTTCKNEMEQWKTVMGGVQRGNKIMTLGNFYKGWTIKLEIKPVGSLSKQSYFNGNILYLRSADDHFVTGLYFLDHLQLHLRHMTNGAESGYEFSNLTLHEWTTVKISHLKMSTGDRYLLKVEINGKELVAHINTKPVEYENVMVYGSSPWLVSAMAFIRNLEISTTPDL